MGYGHVAIAKAELAIADVANGYTLVKALNRCDLSICVFHQVISGVSELGNSYTRARQHMADVLVDEAKEIADDPDRDPQRARNQIDIRKWIASKHNARVYGDRIDVNVSQTISILDALSEAKARAHIQDAEIVQVPTLTGGLADMFT
jgi:hypothetical protein